MNEFHDFSFYEVVGEIQNETIQFGMAADHIPI